MGAPDAGERLDYSEISPELYQAYLGLERLLRRAGFDRKLLELVKLRASQLNGCAYCLDLHGRTALRIGEEPRRLFQLGAWRESGVFTPRERAALAWTEALTVVGVDHVPDTVYQEARSQFSERELVDLSWVVVAINGWNRIAIAFRTPPEPEPTPASP